MLDRLLESGEQRKKSAWGGAASVVVHGAIIALALAATARANTVVDGDDGRVRVVRLPRPVDDGATGRATRDGAGSTGTSTTLPSIPTVDLPTNFDPTLPATTPAMSGVGVDSTLLSEIGAAGSSVAATVGGTGIATVLATDASVDTPVRALVDRAPAYPETLRAAGIGGTVRVRFVVDTTGRAEPSSVRVLDSSHELFTRAVLAALYQARFTPGEVAGHRVRTLVERSYRFDIAAAR